MRIQAAFAPAGPPLAGSGSEAEAALPQVASERLFLPTRLLAAVLGLALLVLLPGAREGGGSVVLLLGATAPLLAALIGSRRGGREASHLLTGASAGALGAVALAGSGHQAWPILLLILVEPYAELLSGRSRTALSALAGAATALAASALAWRSGFLAPHDHAPAASAVLTAQVLCLAGGIALARLQRRDAQQPGASRPADGVPIGVISDLVTWHNAYGDVLRASAGAGPMLGIPPQMLCGGGLLSRVHVADRPTFLKALSDVANGADPIEVELRVRAEHGARGADGDAGGALMQVGMRIHRLEGGAPGGAAVIAFTRDVSAERRRGEELERARTEAERASELKGKFLATVSHELRTPLNAIIGFAELLAAEHPFTITDERRQEYASIIRGSGHHLLELVNTLLDMSKIETGNFHFDPEPFSLRELTESACDLIQLKADEAGIGLERRLERDVPDIVADRRACRQILLNLVSNAVKFTPSGGLVTVALARSGDSLVLSVADTGIGIPEADLPRLGDPFFQSGEVHRRNHEGTGLGLSVVRGLVGLHGGRMSIESGCGAGTTVTVFLPLKGEVEPRPAKPAVLQTLPRHSARGAERKTA